MRRANRDIHSGFGRFNKGAKGGTCIAPSMSGRLVCRDENIIRRGYEWVVRGTCLRGRDACKDKVKIVDDNNIVSQTPERKYVWIVQTPAGV